MEALRFLRWSKQQNRRRQHWREAGRGQGRRGGRKETRRGSTERAGRNRRILGEWDIKEEGREGARKAEEKGAVFPFAKGHCSLFWCGTVAGCLPCKCDAD